MKGVLYCLLTIAYILITVLENQVATSLILQEGDIGVNQGVGIQVNFCLFSKLTTESFIRLEK